MKFLYYWKQKIKEIILLNFYLWFHGGDISWAELSLRKDLSIGFILKHGKNLHLPTILKNYILDEQNLRYLIFKDYLNQPSWNSIIFMFGYPHFSYTEDCWEIICLYQNINSFFIQDFSENIYYVFLLKRNKIFYKLIPCESNNTLSSYDCLELTSCKFLLKYNRSNFSHQHSFYNIPSILIWSIIL